MYKQVDPAMAMLHSTMFECFCSSFLWDIALIINAFKTVVIGEAINTITADAVGKVVCCKSHVNWGASGQ